MGNRYLLFNVNSYGEGGATKVWTNPYFPFCVLRGEAPLDPTYGRDYVLLNIYVRNM
jgi:hypothetical protein